MSSYNIKLVNLCVKNNFTISLAESCTGGMIASSLISVSGASQVIDFSLVTYSNEAKNKFLDVPLKTLGRYGAVSKEVAKSMVTGLSKKTSATICVSVTGIAGPGGGSKIKPVGLIYHGFYFKFDNKIVIKRNNFYGTRYQIRKHATLYAEKFTYNYLKLSV